MSERDPAPRGHVFIVQGDVSRIASHAWSLPTGADMKVEPDWAGLLPEAWREPAARGDVRRPDGWGEQVRAGRLEAEGLTWPPAWPRPWLLDVGGSETTDLGWYMEAVRQYLERASEAALDPRAEAPPWRRDRPLLCLHAVGTGGGGTARRKGDVLPALLEVLHEHVRTTPVDVALVAYGARALAAAQAARRGLEANGGGVAALWPDLDEGLRREADRLAGFARDGQLALFLGAGVSAGAGLPTWSALLDDLAARAGMSDQDREALRSLDPADRARVIERRLGTERPIRRLVTELLEAPRHALMHALLAATPAREAITMNYDTLFEGACGGPIAVLPYAPDRAAARFLLKMHGCVRRPDDIVLTRSDYYRYPERRGALAGIVQSLLMTKHMLFVGFSLTDENFLRITDDVRRASEGRGPLAAPVPPDDLGPRGTALLLFDEHHAGLLWRDELALVPMRPAPERSRRQRATLDASRRLEVFLDYLLYRATRSTDYLLDPDYAGVLEPDEEGLRDALRDLMGRLEEIPADDRSPAWRRVEQFLQGFGAH